MPCAPTRSPYSHFLVHHSVSKNLRQKNVTMRVRADPLIQRHQILSWKASGTPCVVFGNRPMLHVRLPLAAWDHGPRCRLLRPILLPNRTRHRCGKINANDPMQTWPANADHAEHRRTGTRSALCPRGARWLDGGALQARTKGQWTS
jgi:hypothetical protein